MKAYTINEIREEIGMIMKKILNPQFQTIYSQNIEKYQFCLPELMFANQNAVDSLVDSFAGAFHSHKAVNNVISQTSDVLLVCFFIRYHLLTGYLCEQPSDKILYLPKMEKDFFSHLLKVTYLSPESR